MSSGAERAFAVPHTVLSNFQLILHIRAQNILRLPRPSSIVVVAYCVDLTFSAFFVLDCMLPLDHAHRLLVLQPTQLDRCIGRSNEISLFSVISMNLRLLVSNLNSQLA